MAELPFGGFNSALPYSPSESADRLVKIADHMTSGQAVDPELALWFFQAVKIGLTPQGEMAAAGVNVIPSRSTVNAWADHSNVCKQPA